MRKILTHVMLIISSIMISIECSAQNVDSVKIAGIPQWLKWENKPKVYNINKSSISISSGAKTDMFRDPNVTYNTDNAPKILFEGDSNFVISAAVQHAFENKWDGGAIVLKADSLNWIKCCFEKDYTGAKRIVTVVTKGISDDCNSVEIKKNKVFFKIAKADNVITIYYSETGKNWYLIRHFTFDSDNKIKVGFLAQSPTGNNCNVLFSEIIYTKKKIKDPYLGE